MRFYHRNVVALPDNLEPKHPQCLDHGFFRGINGKLRHQVITPVSAMKTSCAIASSSSASQPKVSMWNSMADFT
jgi:hypothetical protein